MTHIIGKSFYWTRLSWRFLNSVTALELRETRLESGPLGHPHAAILEAFRAFTSEQGSTISILRGGTGNND